MAIAMGDSSGARKRRHVQIGGSMSWRIELVHSFLRVRREYFCETRGDVSYYRGVRPSNFESNSMQIRWQLCDGRN